MIDFQPICSNVAWFAVQARAPSSTEVRFVIAKSVT
jgi:hypothetical protein